MNARDESAPVGRGAGLSLCTLDRGRGHANGSPAPSKPTLTGNRCQCAACGEYFGALDTFDRHRVGDLAKDRRRCLTEAEMVARGWSRNGRGFWLRHRREAGPQRTGTAISGEGATALPGQIRKAAIVLAGPAPSA